ncbi:hypothetical protein CFP65_7422 [Kitasatospora sp. MMS16-BH015]|uniref:hypothetical protein n=1 Tax=Kitasatospora sp. MMS16-BH015 TaxID=2018025 RepID=UPI000CA39EC7|nr:hypothetical protein [Kitasatospora sp. MMS16-BH015]AUG82003.1 hypothetical protein CFP65_7422 [Kitasatospora sp. MMS16-BH015]
MNAPQDPDRTLHLDGRTPPPDPAAVSTVSTVKLGPPAGTEAGAMDETVRLAPAEERALGETVRLTPAEARALGEAVRLASGGQRAGGQRVGGDEAESATLLDEEVWGTPVVPVAPAATVELSEATEATKALVTPSTGDAPTDGLRRFGPGVPSAPAEVPALAAAVWHGTVRPGGEAGAVEAARPRRRRAGWLLPVLVLLVVLGYLFWRGSAQPLAVTGVSVSTADPAGPGCDGTATVTGTLRTEGRAGTVSYRWRRSDGTVSGQLAQPVPEGSHQTDVVLRWTFEGKGTMTATATLEVLSPGSRTAATSFTYTCH